MSNIDNPQSEESLDRSIQALPQELQETIWAFTISFDVPAVVFIKDDFRPPIALQLNGQSRARFAKEYYSGTVFTCKLNLASYCDAWNGALESCFCRWLRSLSREHLLMIRHIEIQLQVPRPQHVHILRRWLTARRLRKEFEREGMGCLGHADMTLAYFDGDAPPVMRCDELGRRLWAEGVGLP